MKDQVAPEQEAEQPAKRGRKKLLLILLPLILAAAGGGAYFYLLQDDTAGDGTEQAAPVEIVDPIFVKVGPMTVNLQSTRGDRLLYTSLMVKVGDEDTKKFLNTHMPDINNRMLILLSQQRAEELNALDGKEMVSQKILARLSEPFSDPQPELAIENVFFQDFIVQ